MGIGGKEEWKDVVGGWVGSLGEDRWRREGLEVYCYVVKGMIRGVRLEMMLRYCESING